MEKYISALGRMKTQSIFMISKGSALRRKKIAKPITSSLKY